MVSMRVPEPVKQVFDLFPLETYPRIPGAIAEPKTEQLYVYSLDENGLARDPECLAAQTFFAVLQKPVQVAFGSPYMTRAQTLPLLVIPSSTDSEKATPGPEKLVCGTAVAETALGKRPDDPALNIYETLITEWLWRGWLATITTPSESETLLRTYASPMDQQQPWPVRQSIAKQTEFHVAAKAGYYAGEAPNLQMAGMALTALDKLLDGREYFEIGSLDAPQDARLSVLDVLTFAYIWPLVESFPTSALAALVSPTLHQHVHRVHDLVFPLNKDA